MASSEESSNIDPRAILICTFFFFGIVCQIINIFGIVTNIINIICFVKQGFEDSVNVTLLGLSVSDLASLTTMAWSCVCVAFALVSADLPFDPMAIAYLTSAMPHLAFTRVSGCITAMITLERCLCITAPLKVGFVCLTTLVTLCNDKIKSIITPKRSAVITVCLFIIFVFSGSPVYAVRSLGMTFSASINKTLYGFVSTTGNRENVEKITFIINSFTIPLVAFVIIGVCTAILSFKLRRSTMWRQKTITTTQADRVSSRNLKAARMDVMISTLFIACFVPVSVIVLIAGLLPSISVTGIYINLTMLIASFGYILEGIHSSMNIFIYYNMSSNYRDTLRKLFRVVNEKP